jgi:ribA/ribD-fused uncharacterized protein
MTELHFFDPRDEPTGFLSNFYRASFELDGVRWPTVEHAYQAAKFTDAGYAESIRNADTPRTAKTMGQTHEHPLHADWEVRKQQVMLRLVAAKFCLSGNTELMARLLKTKDQLLTEASPTDNYWGAGADGQGANHLGRILMAVRDVLLECDHENMQATPTGDSRTLHTRVVAEASTLLADPEWDPAYRPPGLHIHVLRGPLYGQGIKQVRESLRSWLGVPLAACWGEESWGCPQLVLQAKVPDHALMGMHHGIHLFQQTSRRLGYRFLHTVATQSADTDWREPETATMPMPPWKNLLDEGIDWSMQAVSVIKTLCQDDDFNHFQYFQPAAQAILLTFCPCDPKGMPLGGEGARRYVALYAVYGEGFQPQVHGYETNPALDLGTPYGMPWELLLCTESLGALPKIEAAFAAHFAHEGIELPAELVVHRRACKNMDDGLDSVTAWNIDVAFGRDERGEYLDLDSCHRMCGEGYVRFHEDGSSTRREEPIAPQRFQSPAAIETEQPPVATQPETPVAPTVTLAATPDQQWAKRGLGVFVMLIGLYIGWTLVANAPRPFQMVIFSLTIVVMGAWMAWRPDDIH